MPSPKAACASRRGGGERLGERARRRARRACPCRRRRPTPSPAPGSRARLASARSAAPASRSRRADAARDHRHARRPACAVRLDLAAHRRDRLGRRPDEHEPGLAARRRERGVLRKRYPRLYQIQVLDAGPLCAARRRQPLQRDPSGARARPHLRPVRRVAPLNQEAFRVSMCPRSPATLPLRSSGWRSSFPSPPRSRRVSCSAPSASRPICRFSSPAISMG